MSKKINELEIRRRVTAEAELAAEKTRREAVEAALAMRAAAAAPPPAAPSPAAAPPPAEKTLSDQYRELRQTNPYAAAQFALQHSGELLAAAQARMNGGQ